MDPTALIIRLSQPQAGDWLAGLGYAWQKLVTLIAQVSIIELELPGLKKEFQHLS